MQSTIPKQYLALNGHPVILATLERLGSWPRLRGLYAGISATDAHWPGVEPRAARIPKFRGTYHGGATRAHTVLNGLRMLLEHAPNSDWVMVHDAVRPCVRHADLDKLAAAVTVGSSGGLLALPLADTVKRADAAGRVVETVPREGLWRALTPQMFRIGELVGALARAVAEGHETTDEAAAIEQVGGRPLLVAGHADNIKITLPGDLALAELFLREQEYAP
jgi:2-C-methyl-D-erythritol 4-phosphate cytidylyltransferase